MPPKKKHQVTRGSRPPKGPPKAPPKRKSKAPETKLTKAGSGNSNGEDPLATDAAIPGSTPGSPAKADDTKVCQEMAPKAEADDVRCAEKQTDLNTVDQPTNKRFESEGCDYRNPQANHFAESTALQQAENAEAEAQVPIQSTEETPLVLCKRCYCDYGRNPSPNCQHIFCKLCYQKSVTNAGDFNCFICARDENNQSQDSTSELTTRQKFKCDANCCVLGKGVKRVLSFGYKHFKRPEKLTATKAGNYVVVDSALYKLLIFDHNGTYQREMSYLYGYSFQGGLAVSQKDIILVGLKNQKYSSVSFYQEEGQFNFSAFLENPASVSSLTTNKAGEILAFNEDNNSICVINEEKMLHTRVQLTSDEPIGDVSSIGVGDINGKERIYTMEDSGVLSVYNYHGSFKHRMALTYPVTSSHVSGRSATQRMTSCAKFAKYGKIMCVDDQGCLLVADRQLRRVDLFCARNGTHIKCLVQFPSQTPLDITVSVAGRCAILLESCSTGADNRVEEFTYSVPTKFRKQVPRKQTVVKDKEETRTIQKSKCCVIV